MYKKSMTEIELKQAVRQSEEVWKSVPEMRYIKMAFALSDLLDAQEDIDGCSKTLCILLYRVCYMRLCPKERSMPFDAIMKYEGGAHSGRLENFDREDFEMLEKIFPIVEDKRIKARIADMLWTADLEQFPLPLNQRFKFLLAAIDLYMELPLEPSTWIQDGEVCWQRCAMLVKRIKSSHRAVYKKFGNRLLSAGMHNDNTDAYFAMRAFSILQEFGIEVENPTGVAERLEQLASQFGENDRFDWMQRSYEAAEYWYHKAKNEEKRFAVVIRHTEALEAESEKIPALFIDRNMAKAKALLMTVPNRYRDDVQYETRMKRIERRQGKARELAISQMTEYSFSIDVRPYIEETEKCFEGKSQQDACATLLKIAHIYGEENVSHYVESCRRAAPLVHHLSQIVYDKNKRLRGESEGISDRDSNEMQSAEENMIHTGARYMELIQSASSWRIIPSLDILHREYRLTERFFEELVASSALVPSGRERMFVKGLYCGYDYDFETAMYILAPQVEHLVRVFLKMRGVNTIVVREGVEDEMSLNALVETEEIKHFFGEKIVFNIRMLFCEPLGANIRNDVAHGLADSEDGISLCFAYAWWFILHLLYYSSRFVYPVRPGL